MTREQFLSALAKTPRSWIVDPDGFLRCAKGDCPITAVYRLFEPDHDCQPLFWESPAHRMELPIEEGRHIVRAADNPEEEPSLRVDLLRACGLEK